MVVEEEEEEEEEVLRDLKTKVSSIHSSTNSSRDSPTTITITITTLEEEIAADKISGAENVEMFSYKYPFLLHCNR